MRYYIALIHKDPQSQYDVSFPDIPGVVSTSETLQDALLQAQEALEFAAQDWSALTGRKFPEARTIDEMRRDPEFLDQSDDALIAVIPLREYNIGHLAE